MRSCPVILQVTIYCQRFVLCFGKDRVSENRGVAGHKASGVNRNHWSASTVSNNTTNAWNTNLSNGNTNNNNKTNSNYVRCVRLGMGSIIPRLSRPFPKNPFLFADTPVCRLWAQSSLSVCRSDFATDVFVI